MPMNEASSENSSFLNCETQEDVNQTYCSGRKIQYYQPSEDVVSIVFPADPTRVTFPQIDFCKCPRSRCLMLYCDCFQAGQVCTSSCVCISCNNVKWKSNAGGLRYDAIETILSRRPDAFVYKPRKTDEGCKCKKNRCLKKYCDCFNLSMTCSSRCTCEDCLNYGGKVEVYPWTASSTVTHLEKLNDQVENNKAPIVSNHIAPQPPPTIIVSRKRNNKGEPDTLETTKHMCPVDFSMKNVCSSSSIEDCVNNGRKEKVYPRTAPSTMTHLEMLNDQVENKEACILPVESNYIAPPPPTIIVSRKRNNKGEPDTLETTNHTCPVDFSMKNVSSSSSVEDCVNNGRKEKVCPRTDPSTKTHLEMLNDQVENKKACILPIASNDIAPPPPIIIVSRKRNNKGEPETLDFSLKNISSSSSLEYIVPLLTEAHYSNLEKLITQFRKVPFITEIFTPLSLQVSSPQQLIDLTLIHRCIKNRLYTSGRSVFLDVMRVIYGSLDTSTNSFSMTSKAYHLSEYFFTLWLEYMVPSDTPAFPNLHFQDFRHDTEENYMYVDDSDVPVLPNDHESIHNTCKASSEKRPTDPYDDKIIVDDGGLHDNCENLSDGDNILVRVSSNECSSQQSAKDLKMFNYMKQKATNSNTPHENPSDKIETTSQTAPTEMSLSDEKIKSLQLSSSDVLCSEDNYGECTENQLLECAVNLGATIFSSSSEIRTSRRSTRRPAKKHLAPSLSMLQEAERNSDMRQTSKYKKMKTPILTVSMKKRESNNREEQTFPQKLLAFVEEVSKTAPHILNWTHRGEAFVVTMTDDNLGPFLLQYFSHGNYASFQRQLNMYGFKKHSKGRYAGSFHHPRFNRDMSLHNLSSFTRQASVRRIKKTTLLRPPNIDQMAPDKNTMNVRTNVRKLKKKISKVADLSQAKMKLNPDLEKITTAEPKQTMIKSSELPESVLTRKKKKLKKSRHDVRGDYREQKGKEQIISICDPYIEALKYAYQWREKKRLERMKMLALTIYLPQQALLTIAAIIDSFINSGCSVDMLDPHLETSGTLSAPSLLLCIAALKKLIDNLRSLAKRMRTADATEMTISDYSINQLYGDLMACYSLTSAHPMLEEKMRGRIHRLLGIFTAPLFEMTIRGINQSSVWASAVAVVWARNSLRLPYRPAIIVGVLAPDIKKELWHGVITEVNESRLSAKFSDLSAEKNKAIDIVANHRVSCFLVEYIGTNEFSWVVEENIIEEFDPSHDPHETFDFVDKSPWFLDALNFASNQKNVACAQEAIDEINYQMIDLFRDDNVRSV